METASCRLSYNTQSVILFMAGKEEVKITGVNGKVCERFQPARGKNAPRADRGA
jgi:hypothetical protein